MSARAPAATIAASINNNSSSSSRRVHFSQHHQIFEIESLASFTKKEIRNSWYAASTIQRRLEKKIDAVVQWDAGRQTSKKLYNIRGLEQYTHRGTVRLERAIERCVTAVLNEQDRAKKHATSTSIYTSIRLKSASQTISMFSVELALIRARKDEMEAKRIYQKLIQKRDKTSVASTNDLRRHPRRSSSSPLQSGELDSMKRKLERICHYRDTLLS